MAESSLRHVAALVKKVLGGEGMEDLLRQGLQAVLSAIMEEEVSELTGAGHGERSAARATHRNGYRSRGLDTGVGSLILRIPKVREGTYFPSFLGARQRSDEALRSALVECYVKGVSTRRAEGIMHALGIESCSKSTVSRAAEALDPSVKAFRERDLPDCPYVYVDARYEHVRENGRVKRMALLVAIGVRSDGAREVLGFHVDRVENELYWGEFLSDLKRRGLRGVRLVVSDAHEGLKRAIAKVLPESKWQRCKVHFLRNMGARLPPKKRAPLIALIKTVFVQESREEAVAQRDLVAAMLRKGGFADAADALENADEVLSYMDFPPEHWTKLHSTNVLERLNRELKRRTRVVCIFPNREALVRLAGALLLEEHEEWLVSRRFISEQSMKKLSSLAQQLDELVPGAGALLEGQPM